MVYTISLGVRLFTERPL